MEVVRVSAGDRILVGQRLVEIDEELASSVQPGDSLLGIAATGAVRRIPAQVDALVDGALSEAVSAFASMGSVSDSAVTAFFAAAARLLADDAVFAGIAEANAGDVESAAARGRSTTRLILDARMRADMVAAFGMWRDSDVSMTQRATVVEHTGWTVEEWRAPLGPIGFVFEGRPNVFADATGVLRSGNVVVFRIGSDALATARAIMQAVITPALAESGLPSGAVVLLDSVEHAAGWRLFSDRRLALAVARGSGTAVAELGAIAQQSGVPASLHGTGGAWLIAGRSADADRFGRVVEHSLDRKVCNTLNVLCVVESRAAELLPIAHAAAERAAARRGNHARIHADAASAAHIPSLGMIEVVRPEGTTREPQVTPTANHALGHEFEWDQTPEFHVVTVRDVPEAIALFNAHSPQFVVSVVSDDASEVESAWTGSNAAFFGDGFTRWVDGQFALLKPELGLSNWQNGRLFGRSGVLSGDSAHSVRLRVRQSDADLHR